MTGSRDRLWRTGQLAQILALRGHEILWWTSTVDHFKKKVSVEGEPRVEVTDRISIQFLQGRLYTGNVSVRRFLNHRDIAKRFSELAESENRPDVVLCSFPTIELSREAVRYGKTNNVPVALDIRDLWPDIFLSVMRRGTRTLGKILLRHQFNDAERAIRESDALFAVSDGYLSWALKKAERSRTSSDAVFPLAHDAPKWTADDEQTLVTRLDKCDADLDKPLAVFVGSFGRTYDLDTVISAADILRQRGLCSAQFILCGAGERDGEWRSAAAGKTDIAFPGWLSAGELACLLAKSTIGLAAYADGAPQGIPNKVVEYLSAGLPVLCSLTGESRDILESEGCGAYYPAGAPGVLADAIETVILDRIGRERMIAASKDVFVRRFSADRVYADMAEQLEKLSRHAK